MQSFNTTNRLLAHIRQGFQVQRLIVWVGIWGIAYLVMRLVPTPGVDFTAGEGIGMQYAPWVAIVRWPMRSAEIQNAFTLTILAFALAHYRAKPIHYLCAFTSLPLYWNLWLCQYDFIPLLGMIWLPWGLPLILVKPQVAGWGLAAWWLRSSDKWKIVILALAGLLLSFLVYGLWPFRFSPPATVSTNYNLSAWQWGGTFAGVVAVGLALFVTAKTRDVDQAMSLGALATPYAQGHSYLILVPALARLSGWRLLVVWLLSWSGMATLFLGEDARALEAIFPLAMWIALCTASRQLASQKEKAG